MTRFTIKLFKKDMKSHQIQVRVRSSETDQMGVVIMVIIYPILK